MEYTGSRLLWRSCGIQALLNDHQDGRLRSFCDEWCLETKSCVHCKMPLSERGFRGPNERTFSRSPQRLYLYRLGRKPDNLSDVERSKCMARFYAEKVIRCVNPGLIPTTDEELAACVVDGSDDCGVDFLSREDNTVLILQAKFSGHKKTGKKRSEDPETFDFFCSVLRRLYAGPKKFKMNQKLKEARAEIDWDHDTFLLHYITLAQPAQNSINQATAGIHPVSDIPDLTDRVGLELLDEQALNKSLRDALSVREESSERAKILFSPNEEQPAWLRFADSVGRV